LVISSENEVDLCFEAKKMCDNDGPPYNCRGQLIAVVAKKKGRFWQNFLSKQHLEFKTQENFPKNHECHLLFPSCELANSNSYKISLNGNFLR